MWLISFGSEQTVDDRKKRQEKEDTGHGVSDGLFARGPALHNLSNQGQ